MMPPKTTQPNNEARRPNRTTKGDPSLVMRKHGIHAAPEDPNNNEGRSFFRCGEETKRTRKPSTFFVDAAASLDGSLDTGGCHHLQYMNTQQYYRGRPTVPSDHTSRVLPTSSPVRPTSSPIVRRLLGS